MYMGLLIFCICSWQTEVSGYGHTLQDSLFMRYVATCITSASEAQKKELGGVRSLQRSTASWSGCLTLPLRSFFMYKYLYIVFHFSHLLTQILQNEFHSSIQNNFFHQKHLEQLVPNRTRSTCNLTHHTGKPPTSYYLLCPLYGSDLIPSINIFL